MARWFLQIFGGQLFLESDILGVPSPFFPGTLLSKSFAKPRENGRFLKETMVENNRDSNPRDVLTFGLRFSGIHWVDLTDCIGRRVQRVGHEEIPRSSTGSFFSSSDCCLLQSVCVL